MISRYFVIVLALVAAVMRARSGAWIECVGLATLAAGLTALRVADLKGLPQLRKPAWMLFGVTVAALAFALYHRGLR